jgi:hypothetical protein
MFLGGKSIFILVKKSHKGRESGFRSGTLFAWRILG